MCLPYGETLAQH